LVRDYLRAARLPAPPGVAVAHGRAARARDGITFVLAVSTVAALRAHAWPGNLRELRHLATAAASHALADALTAAEEGRATASDPRAIPVPARLVRDLLAARATTAPTQGAYTVELRPEPTLHRVAQSLERQLYRRLFD